MGIGHIGRMPFHCVCVPVFARPPPQHVLTAGSDTLRPLLVLCLTAFKPMFSSPCSRARCCTRHTGDRCVQIPCRQPPPPPKPGPCASTPQGLSGANSGSATPKPLQASVCTPRLCFSEVSWTLVRCGTKDTQKLNSLPDQTVLFQPIHELWPPGVHWCLSQSACAALKTHHRCSAGRVCGSIELSWCVLVLCHGV